MCWQRLLLLRILVTHGCSFKINTRWETQLEDFIWRIVFLYSRFSTTQELKVGYLQEVKMIHFQFVAIKMAINETNLVEMVINVLPNSYDSFIQVLSKFGVSQSFDVLVARLIHEENICQLKCNSKYDKKKLYLKSHQSA